MPSVYIFTWVRASRPSRESGLGAFRPVGDEGFNLVVLGKQRWLGGFLLEVAPVDIATELYNFLQEVRAAQPPSSADFAQLTGEPNEQEPQTQQTHAEEPRHPWAPAARTAARSNCRRSRSSRHLRSCPRSCPRPCPRPPGPSRARAWRSCERVRTSRERRGARRECLSRPFARLVTGRRFLRHTSSLSLQGYIAGGLFTFTRALV